MNIRLRNVTKYLASKYFSRFKMDPMLFTDDNRFCPNVYSQEESDARVERYAQLGRVYLPAMLNEEAIGEVVLKNIVPERIPGTDPRCKCRSDILIIA